MITLKHILEGIGNELEYYDLGKDFSGFLRMINGADERINQHYEKIINSKLAGKRVRARASRGYKQYEKIYEFDVRNVTIDDYYDNLVIVAHDYSKKPKEYFLKPGYKIQIIGNATGKPSPQKGGDPSMQHNTPPQHQPNYKPVKNARMATYSDLKNGQLAEDVAEEAVEAYSIDNIAKDINPWISQILKKPESDLRLFIKKLGWYKNNQAVYDIIIPTEMVKYTMSKDMINRAMTKYSPSEKYIILKFEENDGEYSIRIKKILNNK